MRPRTQRFLSGIATAGVIAYWAGMITAARRYPTEYDWRFMTISSLVYPERNPAGHWWASAGIFACGFLGLCWAMAMASRQRSDAGGHTRAWIWLLALGNSCMALAAALPERVLEIPKGHEALALAAFFCLCGGTVQLAFIKFRRSLARHTAASRRTICACAGALAGVALLPILLAAIAQTYVSYALPELPWVNLEWRSLGVPVHLSFAFWEWVTCAVLSAFTVGLTLTTSPPPET